MPVPTHNNHQPESWLRGRMDARFLLVMPNSDPTSQLQPHKQTHQISDMNQTSSCSWLTVLPAVVFCCCSRPASRLNGAVSSEMLFQSIRSSLISDINKAFSPGELLLSGYFHFFRTVLLNSGGVLWENLSGSAVSEIPTPAHLAPATISHSKSLKSPFFSILMLGLNFSRSS